MQIRFRLLCYIDKPLHVRYSGPVPTVTADRGPQAGQGNPLDRMDCGRDRRNPVRHHPFPAIPDINHKDKLLLFVLVLCLSSNDLRVDRVGYQPDVGTGQDAGHPASIRKLNHHQFPRKYATHPLKIGLADISDHLPGIFGQQFQDSRISLAAFCYPHWLQTCFAANFANKRKVVPNLF